jgi:hypothetical protein
MTAAMAKVKAYMMANDLPLAQYTLDYNNNIYWLGNKEELLPEEFAYLEFGTSTNAELIIARYWQCSTYYTKHWMQFNTAPAPVDYTNHQLARCN